MVSSTLIGTTMPYLLVFQRIFWTSQFLDIPHMIKSSLHRPFFHPFSKVRLRYHVKSNRRIPPSTGTVAASWAARISCGWTAGNPASGSRPQPMRMPGFWKVIGWASWGFQPKNIQKPTRFWDDLTGWKTMVIHGFWLIKILFRWTNHQLWDYNCHQ